MAVKLVVNEEEARQVRAIFGLYLEHRSVLAVVDQIQRRQWTTKRWTTKAGRLHVGRAFTQQDVVVLLANRIYAGKVYYQGQTYPGEHAAIIEERVWQRTQRMLQENKHSVRQAHDGAGTHEVHKALARVENPLERVPRITRLLALALKFEGLIHQGVMKDYAELARLGQVSRARVTQIMNLLNLSAHIQAEILAWTEAAPGTESVRETTVRALSSEVRWSRQRELWRKGLPPISTAPDISAVSP